MNINFRHRFEAAHRFTDSNSKCSTPHGHTWWITLTLKHDVMAINNKTNFAEDFKDLKKEWRSFIDNNLDHHFFLNEQDPLLKFLKETEPQLNIVTTKGDPTTEALALMIFKKALDIFRPFSAKITVESLLLEETPTNSVRVSMEDLKASI